MWLDNDSDEAGILQKADAGASREAPMRMRWRLIGGVADSYTAQTRRVRGAGDPRRPREEGYSACSHTELAPRMTFLIFFSFCQSRPMSLMTGRFSGEKI